MEKVRYIISDAAQMIDVESHVLRYWEEELDLKVPRNELGHRYYTKENIEQFQKIKDLKEKGYQLKAIKMLLQEDEPLTVPDEETNIPEIKVHTMPKAKVQTSRNQTAESQTPVPMMPPQASLIQSVPSQAISGQAAPGQVTEGVSLQAEQRMEQFQNLMTGIVKKAIEENNQALGASVGEHVGEKVLKEMNYLVREQEEMAEEYYRKLDEAIRQRHKSRKMFHKKDKALQPKTT